MRQEFQNARQKGLKIYNNEEIKKAGSDTEKLRRQFWNEKAEFLCARSETAHLKKTELYGMIDVAWTLRKTTLLKHDAKRLETEEKEVVADKTKISFQTGYKQKSKTIDKNLDRIEIAHQTFLDYDKQLGSINEQLKATPKASVEQRKKIEEEREIVKSRFDGQFSELKRAQDALNKSLQQRRKIINKQLRDNLADSTSENE